MRQRLPGIAALVLAVASVAHAEPPAKIALTGGRIIPVVGEEIAAGTVVIEYGRITAVGADVEIPYDATEIDVSGKVVFPGLIDPHAPGGLDIANESLAVAPFLDVYDAIDPSRSYFENALREGVTTVHVMQANNTVIGGVSRIVRPIGLSVDEMTVAKDIALKLSTTPKSGYERMRQMAELRETFLELADYLERLPESKYEEWLKENDKEIEVGPEEARKRGAKLVTDADYDDKHANLIRLTRGELAGWIYTGNATDVGPAIRLAKDNGFADRAVYVLGSSAHRAAKELTAAGRPVILPGDLFYRDRDPITGDVEETFIPGVLHRAGVPFAIVPSSGSMAERYLNYQAAVCVRNGIPRQTALEAITLTPARMIGMEKEIGSIEVGKAGNVVIFSGDPLDFNSWVEHVFIDGKHAYDRSRDPRLAELMKLEADAKDKATEPDAETADDDDASEAPGDDADADADKGDGTTEDDGADG